VIIGKEAKRVSREEAMDYVFGYTVLNDISARDIQLNEPQWTRGKTIDGFAPIGPWIVTADELPHPGSLAIKLRLNGNLMQNSNTRELIFDIPYLISFLSNTMTLKPGDVISTGTPPGVGMGQNPQVWLKPGDVVEAEIEGIGVLRNTFVAEARITSKSREI
jgi:2-keto-4-pentenoate hydratase/2-oxohepta-3-ene-1,7-dioic acid hydratase in catechol pathway